VRAEAVPSDVRFIGSADRRVSNIRRSPLLLFPAMRVGVYVDGYNLYYGARSIMGGPGRPGWRWLNLRQMSEDVVRQRSPWAGAQVSRVVFCTARISE